MHGKNFVSTVANKQWERGWSYSETVFGNGFDVL